MKDIIDNYRCSCGKLLLRGFIVSGEVEIKCRTCKKITTVTGLQSLSDHSRHILIVDANGQVVQASSSNKAFGHTLAQMVNRNIQSFILILDPDFYSILWQTLNAGSKKVVTFQTLYKHKDKSFLPVGVSAQTFSIGDKMYLVLIIEKKTAARSQFSIGGTIQKV